MRRIAVAACLLSAVAGPALADDTFRLTPEIGVLLMMPPDATFGAVNLPDNAAPVGGLAPYLGIHGTFGDGPFRLEWSGFYSDLDTVSTLGFGGSDQGSFTFVSPGQVPGSITNSIQKTDTSIVVGTRTDGTATTDWDVNGRYISQAAGPSSILQYRHGGGSTLDQMSATGPAGGFHGLDTGLIAGDHGFVFYGLGEFGAANALSDTVGFDQTFTNSMTYYGGEAHVAADLASNGPWKVSGYLGPLYRRLDQGLSVETTFHGGPFDFFALNELHLDHLRILATQDIHGSYWGGIVGAELERAFGDGTLTFGLAGAPLAASASYDSTVRTNIFPDALFRTSGSADTLAWLGRLSVQFERPWAGGVLSLKGDFEYLSHVAHVVDTTSVATSMGPDSATQTINAPGSEALVFDPMYAASLRLGYTIHF